jgi:hypothetical protein
MERYQLLLIRIMCTAVIVPLRPKVDIGKLRYWSCIPAEVAYAVLLEELLPVSLGELLSPRQLVILGLLVLLSARFVPEEPVVFADNVNVPLVAARITLQKTKRLSRKNVSVVNER